MFGSPDYSNTGSSQMTANAGSSLLDGTETDAHGMRVSQFDISSQQLSDCDQSSLNNGISIRDLNV